VFGCYGGGYPQFNSPNNIFFWTRNNFWKGAGPRVRHTLTEWTKEMTMKRLPTPLTLCLPPGEACIAKVQRKGKEKAVRRRDARHRWVARGRRSRHHVLGHNRLTGRIASCLSSVFHGSHRAEGEGGHSDTSMLGRETADFRAGKHVMRVSTVSWCHGVTAASRALPWLCVCVCVWVCVPSPSLAVRPDEDRTGLGLHSTNPEVHWLTLGLM